MSEEDAFAAFARSVSRRMTGFLYRCRNDAQSTMLQLTPGIEQLVGYAADDLIGNRVLDYASLLHPDDLPRVVAAVTAALGEDRQWQVSYRLRHRDGRVLWVHETGGGVKDVDGQLLYLEGSVNDVTAEKEQEQRLNRLVDDLTRASGVVVAETRTLLEGLRTLSILAMNARIEAARVGTAGAGFNVVANEMKGLADGAGNSAARVTELIKDFERLVATNRAA